MSNEVLGPESAKALQAVSKPATKALELIGQVGEFFGRVLGTVPEDAVGLLLGDGLHEVRFRNLDRLQRRTKEILDARNVASPESVSPAMAKPILEAARDETREELQELWAHLLASAMDPARRGVVRQSFIVTIKGMDPLDAAVLQKIPALQERRAGMADQQPPTSIPQGWSGDASYLIGPDLGRSTDEILVSYSNLQRLGCVNEQSVPLTSLTPYGREFIRCCLPEAVQPNP